MITPKNPKYSCEPCGFNTRNRKDFNRHLMAAKHLSSLKSNTLEQITPILTPTILLCDKCEKSYRSRSGLWNHKKLCSLEKPIENTIITPALILDIVRKNQEMQNIILEQQQQNNENQNKLINKVVELSREPVVINNNNNGNITQNNNQNFNLQFFLNDTCKDAITMKQFIDNIQISLEDLENVGKNGFVKGISDIVLNQLKTLDITKRPIHCTDLKRDTIYLKEEDAWNKDDKENSKLKNAIKIVENKNWRKIPEWQNENPQVMVLDSPQYIMREKILRNVCGNENPEKLREKVIKVIAKDTLLEKEENPTLLHIVDNPIL